MTLSNPTPAERIVSHENKITENIQQIKTNEQLIETQEAAHIDLLAEKTVLDAKSPTFTERVGFDDSLKQEKAAKKQVIEDAREETLDLKKDTFGLKLDTLSENKKLKTAQQDEQALNQQNITELEDAKTNSKNRLDRLESYDEKDPEKATEQAEKIKKEQAVLAKREKDLAEAKKSAANAQEATKARDAKVADEVKEKCPVQCYATKLTVKSNNKARKFSLSTQLNQPSQILHVISLSQKAHEKGLVSPGISTISSFLEGDCEKGLALTSPDSAKVEQLARDKSDGHCPVMKINKNDTQLILPGTSSKPLMFYAFCTEPTRGALSWGYLFRDILLPKYRTPPIEYTIEAQGCDSEYPLVTKIAAHQKIKLELEIALTYKKTEKIQTLSGWKFNPEAENLVEDYTNGHRTVAYGNWLFTIDLKGNIDETDLAFQLQHLEPTEFLSGLRAAINGFIFLFDIIRLCTAEGLGSKIIEGDYLKDKVIANKVDAVDEKGKASAKSAIGSISLVYPKIALGVSYENCEAEGKNILGHATSVALKFAPLIGVQCKVDILAALIKIAQNALMPGAATGGKIFVNFVWPIIKELMSDAGVTAIDEENKEYYLSAGLSLTMDIGANISCEAKWTHIKDAQHLELADQDREATSKASDTVSSAVEIKLEGKVWVKGKIWIVEFEAGLILAVGSSAGQGAAKMEYKLEFSQENDQVMVAGMFEWNGLAIFFQSYKTCAVKQKDSGADNDKRVYDDFGDPMPVNTDTESTETLKEIGKGKHWEIIKPGKTPDNPEPKPLNDYLLKYTKPIRKPWKFWQ